MQNYDEIFMIYLKDVGRYEVLSANEETELAYRWAEKHDIKARELLINSNLRLVIDVAKKFKRKNDDIMDLISSGNVGLIKACDKFDYKKGYKFSTYAEYWIMQHIYRCQGESSLLNYPEYLILRAGRVRRIREKLNQELGRQPTVDEIKQNLAKEKDISGLAVIDSNNIVSLDLEIDDDNKVRMIDLLCDNYSIDNEIENKYLEETIHDLIDKVLTEREKEILSLRFKEGKGLTVQDIGNKLNISKGVTRGAIKKALKKLSSDAQIREFYDNL